MGTKGFLRIKDLTGAAEYDATTVAKVNTPNVSGSDASADTVHFSGALLSKGMKWLLGFTW